jgi:predicted Rossmann fold flavoprotein
VVGGGAAGYFAALACAEANPSSQIILIERSAHPLAKVRISGGGRCNVTHSCFDPAILVTHYPRGGQAMRGPFSRFQPRDTVAWFESHGVPLKTEADGRIFPVSDRSESIIDCLQEEITRVGVRLRINTVTETIEALPGSKPHRFKLTLNNGEELITDRLILATGSSPRGWNWAKSLGHTVTKPVPSLFTFTVKDPRLDDLAGLSTPKAQISIEGTKLKQAGPLLITHWGLSGPAVLKLSAWGARELNACDYNATLHVNWLGETPEHLLDRLKGKRDKSARNLVLADNLPDLPRRLWARLCLAAGIPELIRWGVIGNEPLRALAAQMTDGIYPMTGKSTFKEEFVTCGGVPTDEVDFRTLESKRCPGLYFAGEILDVDGVTGGFNFQSAWTTGWIAGRSAAGLAPQKRFIG